MSRVSDKEFFDIEIQNGITPDNPDYYNLMKATAEIIEEYDPNSVIEIGAGMGTLGECLTKLKINYYGIEPMSIIRLLLKIGGNYCTDLTIIQTNAI